MVGFDVGVYVWICFIFSWFNIMVWFCVDEVIEDVLWVCIYGCFCSFLVFECDFDLMFVVVCLVDYCSFISR